MRLVRVCALVALGASGCTAGGPVDVDITDVSGRSTQIKDGYDDADDTGVMAISNAGAGSLCSGSLIAPNVILTARHCVSTTNSGAVVSCGATAFNDLAAPGAFFVTSAPEVTPGNLGEFLVEAVVGLAGMPGIPGSVEDDAPFCGNDIALLILQKNVPVSVAVPYEPLLDGPLEEGLPYYAVGYGAINGAGAEAGTRRRRDDLSVVCDGEADCLAVELTGVADGEWSGNGGVCSGDSGGPALDLEDRVVGVTSRGDEACDVSVYANPDAHALWLKNATVFASGMALNDPPAWTDGATVDPEHAMPVGELCESGDDCPTGICVKESESQYCSRPCTDEGPCPEDYACTESGGDTICTSIKPDPPLRYQRPEDDGCSCATGPRPVEPSWIVVMMGLSLFTRRRLLTRWRRNS